MISHMKLTCILDASLAMPWGYNKIHCGDLTLDIIIIYEVTAMINNTI